MTTELEPLVLEHTGSPLFRKDQQSRTGLFLDRDGVLVEELGHHILNHSEIQVIKSAAEALKKLSHSEIPIIVVTNQSAIGRGILSVDQTLHIHRRIVDTLSGLGAHISATILCPHAPADGCLCRKPSAGMYLTAEQRWNINLRGSMMIGDSLTDVEGAASVNMRAGLVLTGKGHAQAAASRNSAKSPETFSSLRPAVQTFLEASLAH